MLQFKRFSRTYFIRLWLQNILLMLLGRWIETGGKLTVKDDKGMDEVPVFKWEAEIDEGRLGYLLNAAATMRLNKLFLTRKNGPNLTTNGTNCLKLKKESRH